MTGREQIRIQVLMTGDAGVGPGRKAQIAHPGADGNGISPIPACSALPAAAVALQETLIG